MSISSATLVLKKWTWKNLEMICWISGLLLLFLMNSGSMQPSLCIFRIIGFTHCPGCGIGHAIHFALHFQFRQSLQSHLMGIPATLIIIFRIYQLLFLKLEK